MSYKMSPAWDCRVRIFFGVSWGELTSSKLIAQSYEEAAKSVPTTDYKNE